MYSTCVSTIALETLLKRLGGGLRMLNLRGDPLFDNRAAKAIAMYCTSLRVVFMPPFAIFSRIMLQISSIYV